MEPSTIIILCAAVLIVLAVIGTVRKARGKAKASCCGSAGPVIRKAVEDTDESHYPFKYTVSIDGMACSNCARTVENALNAAEGTWARVDLGKHRATVLAKTERSRDDFAKALRGTSYKVTDSQPA